MLNEPLEQAKRELALIPKGDLAQNQVRMVFFALRENSLGSQPEITPDVSIVFEKAKERVRIDWPVFEPLYDPRLLGG